MGIYAVIGLGYVGLNLAVSLAQKHDVIGYDINSLRIDELQNNLDRSQLLTSSELESVKMQYTCKIEDIARANFYIVSVSTPVYAHEIPDLEPLLNAVSTIAEVIKKGDIIVFESTVYPGTTEEICVPRLEKLTGLKCGRDFEVGYSPERINPGDNQHTLQTTTKIIAAQNKKTLDALKVAYGSICDTVYPVSEIKIAEAIKILENTQRDVNIAFMNEFAKIMHALNLNMQEILEGAKTKWNHLPFRPGLVGGHCISVDPYYLAFKAKQLDVYPEIIIAARKINDQMPEYLIQEMFKILTSNHINTQNLTVGIFGMTYKENVNDLRNSLSIKILEILRSYRINCLVHDAFEHPNLNPPISKWEAMQSLDVAMINVGHEIYIQKGLQKIMQCCKKPMIIMDIPNLFVKEAHLVNDLIYWPL